MRLRARVVVRLLIGASLISHAALPAAHSMQASPKSEQLAAVAAHEVARQDTATQGIVHVAYADAINQYFSRGVTPQNNAAVLLYQVMGPTPERCPLDDRFFELLGMPKPPADGVYLTVPADLTEAFDAARQGPWRRRDHPEMADWLEQNAGLLETLHAATKRTRYFSPLVVPEKATGAAGKPGLFSVLLPGIQQMRTLARVLIARANLKVGSGDRQPAIDDLLAAYRLGRLVGQGPTLVEGLVGIAIENMTAAAIPACLSAPGLTQDDLSRLTTGLDQLPDRADIADKIEHGERYLLLDFAQTMAQGETPDFVGEVQAASLLRVFRFRSLDWDWIAQDINGWYDRLAAAMRLEEYEQRQTALRQIEQQFQQLQAEVEAADSSVFIASLKLLASGRQEASQRVSRVLLQMGLPAIAGVSRARDRAEQHFRNLHAAIALVRYRLDHADRYPDVLVQLVPDYLTELPLDLFAARPVQYRRDGQGFVLYSVGPNELDEEGRAESAKGEEADVVVRLPR